MTAQPFRAADSGLEIAAWMKLVVKWQVVFFLSFEWKINAGGNGDGRVCESTFEVTRDLRLPIVRAFLPPKPIFPRPLPTSQIR